MGGGNGNTLKFNLSLDAEKVIFTIGIQKMLSVKKVPN